MEKQKRFEYKVEEFYQNSVVTFTEWLNKHGENGWQVVDREDTYYAFMREIPEQKESP